MKHPVSRELHRYWTVLRGGRAAPERSELDPAAISGVLADTFILEVGEPNAAPFQMRLSGARLNALWLAELKGRAMPSLFKPADRPEALRVLRTVLDQQVPALAGLRATPVDGGRAVDLEMILLPLKHRGRTHARLLGAAAPYAVPSWLGLVPVEGLDLVSVRYLHEAPGTFDHVAQATRRHGHLTVHEGGRAP